MAITTIVSDKAAKASGKAAKKAAEIYTFFNPKLRDDSYATGHIYDKDQVAISQAEWEIDSDPGSYLTHVKSLSNTWPHLRLLADFMEISTTPLRWRDLQKKEPKDEEREQRAARTNVTRLDYLNSGKVMSQQYNTSAGLDNALTGGNLEKGADERQLRLFVVEDLSRDVIELLGKHLDIEPGFFREHIVDYAWYNTRDRWVDPPNLNMINSRNRWVPIRFVTARYFETYGAFQQGFEEARKFNVLRRPDDDQNNKSVWDEEKAIVGVTRTKASIWYGSAESQKTGENQKTGAVAVLLLDPTIQAGVPLWYGYRNWEATPSIKNKDPIVGPPRTSLYDDFVYWAKRPEAFKTTAPPSHPDSNHHIPIQALLHIICAEWLTIADYIKTRLGQIEWEISTPEHFLEKHSEIDVALKKLHVWRRLVPLYREELTETLQRVFHFPCHSTNLISSGNGFNQCSCALQNSAPVKQGPINAFRDDFARALSYMEEYQLRIDRLTSVVTATISIKDSRRSQEDNRNVARLTWLATGFIPLSFVATLFSMQTDITLLQETYKWYFAAALPLAALSLIIAFMLALPPSVRKFASQIKVRLVTPRVKTNR